MNTDEYLQRFQLQLMGFSAEEKAELVEEIAAHIEVVFAWGRDVRGRLILAHK